MSYCFLISKSKSEKKTKNASHLHKLNKNCIYYVVGESTDPTLDDDNKSDSDDEYEYEEIIEEYEEEVEEDFTTPVTISEGDY